MKRKIVSALLAGVLCALCVLPAGAAGSDLPALTVRTMGLQAVERAVDEDNATVRALRKTAEGVDTASTMSKQLSQQSAGLQAQIGQYDALIGGIESAMAQLSDTESALYQTYAMQKKLLEGQRDELQQSVNALPLTSNSAISQIREAADQISRQADNVADQMAMGAQTILISLKTLEYTQQQLNRSLSALDRNISVLETQFSIGMASQYQLDAAKTQRGDLALSISTLEAQCENLASSLAIMCGCDAGTIVKPSTLAMPAEGDYSKMNYEKDLASAQENSFSVWQKKTALRQAQNAHDSSLNATGYAVQSAKEALEAEQSSVEAGFDNAWKTVSDSRDALRAAQTAEKQAELDFRASKVQYSRGMISRFAYQQAEDTLANAKTAVSTAELDVISAFNQYEWAKKGLVSSAAA